MLPQFKSANSNLNNSSRLLKHLTLNSGVSYFYTNSNSSGHFNNKCNFRATCIKNHTRFLQEYILNTNSFLLSNASNTREPKRTQEIYCKLIPSSSPSSLRKPMVACALCHPPIIAMPPDLLAVHCQHPLIHITSPPSLYICCIHNPTL